MGSYLLFAHFGPAATAAELPSDEGCCVNRGFELESPVITLSLSVKEYFVSFPFV